MATKAESLINALEIEVARLTERVSNLREETASIRDMAAQLAVIKEQITELKKMREEADRGYWQFILLFVGGIVTLAINIVVSFIKK